ncbi:type II secretion system F family protein [Microbacterium sp. No. 7]|uniref:type II secretion system F family protein n=1 Tax=Microbacterium sp. No. 7 TaxID=1714373 RepID=UPI0006D24D34|nr:type II secretion system F family protein [Microbacterium sp. No. 7]ALJ20006.1 type II secretion protein F [Microbacterium sp. No. 7]
MNVLGQLAGAVVLGAALAAGILLVATRVPRWAAPSLSRRIAPYVRDVTDPRGLTPLAPPRPAWHAARDRVIAAWGGADALAVRLRRAGRPQDVAGFRARQLTWTLVGLAVGGALAVALALAGRAHAGSVVLPVLGAVAALALTEAELTAAARRRAARIADELPTVLEFLALCLAAGEGLRDALRRVGDIGSGELTAQLRRAVLATDTGSSLSDALLDMARALHVPALGRAVEHIVAALDRGAPLAQVLQSQAGDAREDAKRVLIESAGRREILMLLPLVFLVLPLSVLFAIFPGVVMLRLGTG